MLTTKDISSWGWLKKFSLNVLSYVLGLFCKGQNGAHVMEITT